MKEEFVPVENSEMYNLDLSTFLHVPCFKKKSKWKEKNAL